MKIDWIAIDWGTSNLRIWAMDLANMIVDEKRSDQGMGGLASSAFEPVLLKHISGWLGNKTMPIVACGMVGSREGWHEAPYCSTPTRPITTHISAPVEDSRIDVRILSGIRQANPADVMRGEETQIAGFLAKEPDFEGVICLPGTHAKWADISKGKITKFQTLITGELFALLSKQSVLRHSMGEWDDKTFLQKVTETCSAPEKALATLFEIRASSLLKGTQDGIAHLSGVLIGFELSTMIDYWSNKKVVVIGVSELARLYAMALETLDVAVRILPVCDLSLAGLKVAYKEIFL